MEKDRFKAQQHPDSTIVKCLQLFMSMCGSHHRLEIEVRHYSTLLSVYLFLPLSGGRSAGSHDPEERVDVVALDGISTGRDHLVLGLTH